MALARVQNQPYDSKRFDLFQTLYEALMRAASVPRTISHASTSLPFFEAYFSNFIEGIEFEANEAAKIVFEGKIPKDRLKDAHDIIGTYQIASDLNEMRQTPANADEFIALLKKRHTVLMQGRPEMVPGQFKTAPNRAGSTLFVAPELVEGTLKKGFQWLLALESPFQKAVFTMFLVAEVHPFADGNGRCGRLMMNSELVAANQARILIPTIFRSDYLAALKALSHNGKADPLIRVLDFAQKYTSLIDWSDYKRAYKMLQETHAFEDSSTAELMGYRLTLPE